MVDKSINKTSQTSESLEILLLLDFDRQPDLCSVASHPGHKVLCKGVHSIPVSAPVHWVHLLPF